MASNPRIPFALASSRKPIAPPQGKPLIVHLVVNVENWQYDHAMPRKVLPAPHGVESLPDIPNFSWAEYGMRCGMPRFLSAIGDRGLPASCAINAAVIDAYPELARAILAAGWEFIGHGMHQRAIHEAPSEAALIKDALDRISRFTGKPVEGWLSPGLRETAVTPDLLAAAGIRYCCDWALDDLPLWMHAEPRPLIAMPYALEVNDSVAHAVQMQPSDAMLTRLEASLATIESELDTRPFVLTIGLHPHLMGVPHRFCHFEAMLDRLMAHPRAIFMTGSQIADWYEAEGDLSERAAVEKPLPWSTAEDW